MNQGNLQNSHFDWPDTLLLVVLAVFVFAILAPWFSTLRRLHRAAVILPAVSASVLWWAYELSLDYLARPGDPLIRIDLFLLIPFAIIAWLSTLLALPSRR